LKAVAKKRRKNTRRQGSITKAERALVKQVILDQPAELTPRQITGLSAGLRRSKDAIKTLIQEAREDFAASAKEYVDVHAQATAGALATMDFEVAGKLAQWGMTNISAEGVRIVDKPEHGPTGAKILIGIRVGGINQDAMAIPVIEAEAG
jgi:hypothetical protein